MQWRTFEAHSINASRQRQLLSRHRNLAGASNLVRQIVLESHVAQKMGHYVS